MFLNRSLCGFLAISLASCASPTGARSKKLQPVANVDLARYMGPWRVIACMDNKLERDFVDSVETYSHRADGKIGVHFAWREKSFDAPIKTHDFTGKVVPDGTNARWKMRLFPLFTASYVIVKVLPDYSAVAVAHPSRKFGWILARQRTVPDAEYRGLAKALQEQGYDTSKLIFVPQERGGGRSS